MHTQTSSPFGAPRTSNPHASQSAFRARKTAIRFFVAGAILLGIGFTACGMLRAQFGETFSAFPNCHGVAPDRLAVKATDTGGPGA